MKAIQVSHDHFDNGTAKGQKDTISTQVHLNLHFIQSRFNSNANHAGHLLHSVEIKPICRTFSLLYFCGKDFADAYQGAACNNGYLWNWKKNKVQHITPRTAANSVGS